MKTRRPVNSDVGRFFLIVTKRMKRLVIVIGAVLIIGVGVFVMVASRETPTVDSNAVPPVVVPSELITRAEMSVQTVFRLNLCDVVRDGDRWNGKFVSMRVVYEQGVDTAAFIDPRCEDGWVRPACYAPGKSCDETWKPLTDAVWHGHSWRVRVDVVGRYIADIVDPNPMQGGNHVRMLEVTSIKNPVPQDVRE